MECRQAKLYALRMDGRRIRAARLARKLTLRQVAESMGVTPQAVAQWEKSTPLFDPDKLRRLADSLMVESEWLNRITDVISVPSIENYDNKIDRIPIIYVKEQALLYFVFSKVDRRQIENLPTIEPSFGGSKNSFAVVIEQDDEYEILKPGNIAIFDVDITPEDDDIVLAFALRRGEYKARYLKFKMIKDNAVEPEKLFVAKNMAQHYSPENVGAFDGVVALGVLVELRWLRGPEAAR